MRVLLTLLSLTLLTQLTAQVGINTDDPQQALEVDGKIALGDDNRPATEGTLRYNTQTKQFSEPLVLALRQTFHGFECASN